MAAQIGNDQISLIIKSANRATMVRANKSWTVQELKQHYCDTEGGQVGGIRLIYRGKLMHDNRRLADFGLNENAVIAVTFMAYGGGGSYNDDDSKEGANERQAFLDTSRKKKQYYNQYKSLKNLNVNNIDDKILVDDPHFVLTLNDLSDFNVNNNQSEVDKLKELKNCIENKLQNPIIDTMRNKLAAVYQVDAARVVITDVYHGTTNIAYIIVDYEKDGVVELIKTASQFEAKMKAQFKQFKDVKITPVPESTDGSYAVVKSLHVSCASGKACGNWNCPESGCRLAGVVLYMKDGKKRWKCNGRSCRMGYIIVKQTNKIPSNVTSSYGAIHGRVYKSVFNEEPEGIVGSGFSRSGGVWKWGSGSFNGGSTNKGNDKYHNGGYTMNEIESKWIEKAIKNWWESGKQNTAVSESLVIFKDQ